MECTNVRNRKNIDTLVRRIFVGITGGGDDVAYWFNYYYIRLD